MHKPKNASSKQKSVLDITYSPLPLFTAALGLTQCIWNLKQAAGIFEFLFAIIFSSLHFGSYKKNI